MDTKKVVTKALCSSDAQTPTLEQIQSEISLVLAEMVLKDQTCDIQLALLRYQLLTVSVAI